MKPIVKISGAWLEAGRLRGIVYNYPSSHMWYEGCVVNGQEVCTSPVQKYNSTTVETGRTIYEVLNWKSAPNFVKMD